MELQTTPSGIDARAPAAPTATIRTPRSAWKVAAAFVAVAACVLGGIATVNDRLNPLTYDREQLAAVAGTLESGRGVAMPDINIDWRALRTEHFEAMQGTPDIVLFGGSRWEEATSAFAPGKRFYNAFVTNDFFDDIVALTGLLYTTHHLPKTLVLSVRFFSVDYLTRHDPIAWKYFSPEYRAMSERLGVPAHSWVDTSNVDKYSHLLSADAAFDKLRRRQDNPLAWQGTTASSDAINNVVRPDGALRFSDAHLASLTPAGVEQDALQTAAEHRTQRVHIDRALLGQLGTLISFLKRNGVQVVLVQTPFHPAYLKAIQGSPYFADIVQVEDDTRRVAAQSGAVLAGGFDSLAQGCLATDYRDFNHASDRCLSQVLRKIPGLD